MADNIKGEPIVLTDPEKIPLGWDDLFADNRLFNSKAFLKHLHRTNPVFQKYYYSDANSGLALAGTLYLTTLPFRLGPLCLSYPVTVCGIPMIYGSQPGFSPEEAVPAAAKALERSGWPGFQWVVGLSARTADVPGWCWKRFLTTVNIPVQWNGFGQYLEAMRSDYRKQVMASLRKKSGLEISSHTGNSFSDPQYDLFLQVHRAAGDKTIPLSKSFFKDFPIDHHYIRLSCRGTDLGWALLVSDGSEAYLLYIGYDMAENNKFDTYINLLLESIKYAIGEGYKILKMGQTAELIKMRLGGVPSERYILVRHTNPIINEIVKRTDILNYRKHYPLMHVFK